MEPSTLANPAETASSIVRSRAMTCKSVSNLVSTAVPARSPLFAIWLPCAPPSTKISPTSTCVARAVESFCRRWLQSCDGLEAKQYPIRLEFVVVAHWKQEISAPADKFSNGRLQIASNRRELIDLCVDRW